MKVIQNREGTYTSIATETTQQIIWKKKIVQKLNIKLDWFKIILYER